MLKRSSYGRVRSSIRCPNKRAIENALLPQFQNFISVIREVCDQMPPVLRLRELPLRWRRPYTPTAALRPGTAAVVKRSAALDCDGEPSGFRSCAWVCKFHAAHQSDNVTVIHVPRVCQASVFLQRMLRVVGTSKLFGAAKLEVG